jgi:hypothetical protein
VLDETAKYALVDAAKLAAAKLAVEVDLDARHGRGLGDDDDIRSTRSPARAARRD